MDYFKKYLKIFTPHIIALRANSEFEEVFGNYLFDLSGPKHLNRDDTSAYHFFSKLFYGFSEIASSYYSLVDIETYIGSFPYSKKKISRIRCMNYHIENYFNEIYILRERLLRYLTTVGRLHKKDPNHADILKYTKPLFSLIKDVFDGIVTTRSSHVHERRFKDDDIDRLASLEMLVEYGGEELGEELSFFENLLETDYRIIRKKYKKTFTDNNTEIKKVLDLYFETLSEIVTTKDGKLNYPKAIKV